MKVGDAIRGVVMGAVMVAAAGCGMIDLPQDPNAVVAWPDPGPPGVMPWPDPPRPNAMPPAMEAAVRAAQPTANEMSFSGLAALRTAFRFDLASFPCTIQDEWCRGKAGPAWGVVFEVTGGDGHPMRLLVILDSTLDVLTVDGWDYPSG